MRSFALVLLVACAAPAAESPPDAAAPDVAVAGWELARTEHTFDLACVDTTGEYRIVQARTSELTAIAPDGSTHPLGAPLPDPAPARHVVHVIGATSQAITVETLDDPGPCADRGVRTTTLTTGLLPGDRARPQEDGRRRGARQHAPVPARPPRVRARRHRARRAVAAHRPAVDRAPRARARHARRAVSAAAPA